MGPEEGGRERENEREMSDAVVAAFTFPTHCTHTHRETRTYQHIYMLSTANLPVSARLKSAG